MSLRTLVVLSIALLAGAPVHAATIPVVNVSLRDASTDPSVKGMVLQADSEAVKAGRVTFRVVNESKNTVHEMLVVPAPKAGEELPFNRKADTVDEKRAHSRGEVSDLKPGAHGQVTLNLKAGNYLLLCNQPGHYHVGMSTRLTVEK
ncbi:MAG TPA: plastocyanin/azurin family copper-binding protein [Casimicrobiaceae bacterium]|nr:plastocyanin/azurin family copper-binding protein [Casimicrobiaceae bacterium]